MSRNDLTGRKFHRLTVQKATNLRQHRSILWECICACRNTCYATSSNLISGRMKSCGCWRLEQTIKRSTKHGASRRHAVKSEYRIWQAMKKRCFYEKDKSYPRYGGRGITICKRWRDSFQTFLRDMGKRPSKKRSIHRIDNDGNYEPKNCIWATSEEQAKNKTVFNPKSRFTSEQVKEIRTLLAAGTPNFSIALRYGVDRSLISNIKTGRTWKGR